MSYNITLLENMERFATEEEARILVKVVGSTLAPVDVTPSLFDQLFSKRPFAMHDTFEITRLATPPTQLISFISRARQYTLT